MVRSLHVSRRVGSGLYAGATNYVEIVNPTAGSMGAGAHGKGALRGIRVQNLHTGGWHASGFQAFRIIIDDITWASGQLRIPYIDGQRPGRGVYLNLGMLGLGADYHEEPYFAGSGACCDCAMLVNEQRVPFSNRLQVQAAWTSSGTSTASGFSVDVWYEIKGR